MKKAIATTALILALVGGVIGATSTATAHPSKTKSCSSCHKSTTATTITLTKVSQTSTKATYKIKITGGTGKAGWAVLRSSSNLAHKSATTGTFTVKRGRTYKVWAVKTGKGSRYKTLTVK
jgi:hypothetical protein